MNKLNWHSDTQVEFDAILVENIFRSKRGLTLRKNHWGWDERKGSLVPPASGYDRSVNSFRARTPRLAHALAGVNAHFNPFRKGSDGYVAPPSAAA